MDAPPTALLTAFPADQRLSLVIGSIRGGHTPPQSSRQTRVLVPLGLGPAFPPFQTSHHLPPLPRTTRATLPAYFPFHSPLPKLWFTGPSPALYSVRPVIPTCIYTSLLHRFPRRAWDHICRANSALPIHPSIYITFLYPAGHGPVALDKLDPTLFHGADPLQSPDSLPRQFLLLPTFPAASCSILAHPGSPDGPLVESNVFFAAAVVVVESGGAVDFPRGFVCAIQYATDGAH